MVLATEPSGGRASALQELDGAIGRLVAALRDSRTQARMQVAMGVDIEPAQLFLLRAVALLGEARPGDLARSCRLDQSTISRHSRGLLDAGLVRRTPEPDDRRAARLTLTGAGKRAYKRYERERAKFLAEALRDWSDRDAASLAVVLNRLVADLDRARSSSVA